MSVPTPAVLLLGGLAAAVNQRYLCAAAARDLTVLVVDAPATDPEDRLARWRTDPDTAPAEVARLDAVRVTEIVDRAAAWSSRYAIRGVCPLRDGYVDAAALVADLLGLPSPGLRAARVSRDRDLQRHYLPGWTARSAPVPPARRAEAVAGWTRFPAAITPVGRDAGSGVRTARDAAELRAALGAYGPNERLVFEERAPGERYRVDSVSVHGEVRHLEVTRREAEPAAPGSAAADRRRLAETHAATLERLAFDTGLAHAEYRQVAGAAPTLIDFAARPSGDGTPVVRRLGGGALEDALIGLSVGEDVTRSWS